MNFPRLIIVLAAWALLAPAAAVASAPGASTGSATNVTGTTATLTGTVNPNKEDTTWYFEYGTTTSYGSKTTEETIGGNAGKDVEAALAGLTPNTTYHYRLVAVNPSGTDFGADMTFTTTDSAYGVPAFTCKATPRSITFGRSTTISGQLTGEGNAGVKVQVQQDPYPYGDGFADVGEETTTDANGNFSVPVTPALNTRYQAVAKASPPMTCAAVQVRVRHKVTLKVSDNTVRRGQKVRFKGRVLPAHNGRKVQIQRRTSSGFKTVAKARLRPAGAASKYRKTLRIKRKGTYRVRFPGDGAHATGVSRKRTIKIG